MRNINVFGLLLILLAVSSCIKKRQADPSVTARYACPMHPRQIFDKPGQCPICKMDLVKIDTIGGVDSALMLGENQRILAGIKTVVVHSGSVGNDVVLAGRLVQDQDVITKVSARVGGRVEQLFYREAGVAIKAGDPLYEIFSEELQNLQREYLSVESDRSLMQSAERRLILAGMSLDQISQLKTGKKILRRTVILSPVSGTIAEINIQQGQYTDAGTTLYTVGTLDKLWAEIELYPDESGLVNVNDDVMIRVTGFSETTKTKIVFLERAYRAGSQIFLARAVVSNRQHRYASGTEIKVTLPDKPSMATFIPSAAIIHDTHGDHVWIEDNDESFSMRSVIVGREGDMKTEIVKGLTAGDHVVTAGALLLDAEWNLRLGFDLKPTAMATRP